MNIEQGIIKAKAILDNHREIDKMMVIEMVELVETILTAYEKEKEEHKKECHNCDEYTARLGELETENRMLKSELEKEKEKNSNAKWYIHQEIVRIKEDIEDYIDDGKEGNKHIIGEFKEDVKQWQDVEKLLNGKSKDELYMDWRKYGEYE